VSRPAPAPTGRGRVAALAAVSVVLLTGCSDGGGAQAEQTPAPTGAATPSPTPTPTPSVSPPPTPGEEFSAEVEELYALVKRSVEGSGDLRGSSTVLDAFATTVALVRVPPELTDARQGVVDAAEAAAQSYGTAAGITGAVERAAARTQAVVRLRELELVIRTLPE
jgi:hypothetical protein